MWIARECGDAHKRLIAPRWFERKERSTVFGEPHPPIQTHTHSSTCLVCAAIATTCVCPLFWCVFVVCVTRGLAQSKHQALVMTIALSKPINLNPHHVHATTVIGHLCNMAVCSMSLQMQVCGCSLLLSNQTQHSLKPGVCESKVCTHAVIQHALHFTSSSVFLFVVVSSVTTHHWSIIFLFNAVFTLFCHCAMVCHVRLVCFESL